MVALYFAAAEDGNACRYIPRGARSCAAGPGRGPRRAREGSVAA